MQHVRKLDSQQAWPFYGATKRLTFDSVLPAVRAIWQFQIQSQRQAFRAFAVLRIHLFGQKILPLLLHAFPPLPYWENAFSISN